MSEEVMKCHKCGTILHDERYEELCVKCDAETYPVAEKIEEAV